MIYKFGIIGAGRLGTTFAAALQSPHFQIEYIYDHSGTQGDILHSYFPNTAVGKYLDVQMLNKCNVVILSVRDDMISEVVNQLNHLKIQWRNKIILHTSGAFSSDILNPLAAAGGETASMHPFQTFSSKFGSPEIFDDVIFTCEGSEPAMRLCKKITTYLKATFLRIDAAAKTAYHLGGTISSNLLIALLEITTIMFRDSGFKNAQQNKMIEVITKTTINNFLHDGSLSAITGPLARGDCQTVQKHLKYLSACHPQIEQIYRLLSKYILDHVLDLTQETRQRLDKCLDD